MRGVRVCAHYTSNNGGIVEHLRYARLSVIRFLSERKRVASCAPTIDFDSAVYHFATRLRSHRSPPFGR